MNKEQLLAMRKQCDTAEENAKSLNVRVAELISQLDTCRSQCTQLNQEKEILQKGLDTMRLEKNALDKNRVELNSMVRLETSTVQHCSNCELDGDNACLYYRWKLSITIMTNFKRQTTSYRRCATIWKMKNCICKTS